VRLGGARRGTARPGVARLGPARLGKDFSSTSERMMMKQKITAMRGMVRIGSAWSGGAWKG